MFGGSEEGQWKHGTSLSRSQTSPHAQKRKGRVAPRFQEDSIASSEHSQLHPTVSGLDGNVKRGTAEFFAHNLGRRAHLIPICWENIHERVPRKERVPGLIDM